MRIDAGTASARKNAPSTSLSPRRSSPARDRRSMAFLLKTSAAIRIESRARQPIAGAAHGQQVARLGRIALDLAPQLRDVNVYRARLDAEVLPVAPHLREQLLARHRAVLVREQVLEDLELATRE